MKWIGTQTIYDNVRLLKSLYLTGDLYLTGSLYDSTGGTGTLPIVAGDLTMYNAVNDGNPTVSLGSSSTERLEIKAQYESGAQGLDGAIFTTYTAGSSTNDGRFTFFVDEVGTFQIRDHGINLYAGKSLQIGNTDIISDSGGTATLSNIDALDATTISTFNAALTAGDITGVTITTDSGGGSAASDTGGSADFSILGATGVSVTNSGTTITATAVPGEIDHNALLNFDENRHFTQSGITTVGTIGTGVWQGTAIASAYLDADTAHISATKEVTHHNYKANQGTTETYVGLADADSEGTSTTAVDMLLTAPVAGKLLKVFLRSDKNINSHALTFRLRTISTGSNLSATPAIIGAQTGAGCQNSTMTTYNFTTGLDSEGAETNAIAAGDAVFLTLQSDTSFGNNVKYYITCLWEWDLS
tara:strand:- start:4219 stop:5466 length:1248 start_codon:yes stop_codon:yes gene_type:complete